MTTHFARLSLLAASLALTACGQPLTIAAWMNAEPGAEVSVRIFRQTITGPLEGGVFTIIRLDLSNPLHITGTIDVPQVRLGSPGFVCIRKDTANPVRGSIEIDLLSGEQNVDFPLAVIAGGPIFPDEFTGAAAPPPGSIQFPIDAALLEPVLATGSLEGQLALPISLDQTFQIGSISIPSTVLMTLRSSNRPPEVSAEVAAECGESWAKQGSELDYGMNARGTYLHTALDQRQPPQVIDLAALGVAPGERIQLRRKGSYSDNVQAARTRVAGVFSATSALRANPIGGSIWNFNWSRVPGALDAGTDVTTPRTLWFANPTDIRQDFEVGSATVVTVPIGARFLFLTPIDNHFDENFSFDLRVGIDRAP